MKMNVFLHTILCLSERNRYNYEHSRNAFFILDKFRNRCLTTYLTSLVNTKMGVINAEVDLYHPENIYLGDNSYVNGGKLYAGIDSKIVIGNDCMISYGVHIRTTTHNYKSRSIPMKNQGGYERDIVIEDNCWIGYGAQIMPGVIIHKGSVVGAGAVVTRDVDENTVVGGIPARVISRL